VNKETTMEPTEAPFEVFAGLETSMNDPFVVTRGLRAGLGYTPLPLLGVAVTAAWSPDLGRRSLTERARNSIEENALTPNVSKILGSGTLSYQVTPIRVPGDVSSALHLGAGVAALYTVDDFSFTGSGARDSRDLNLGWTANVDAEVLYRDLGVRIGLSHVRYTERFQDQDDPRALWLVGAAGVYAF
jgi:hypothetical protein